MVVYDVYTVGVVVIVGVVIKTPPVCLKHVEKNARHLITIVYQC